MQLEIEILARNQYRERVLTEGALRFVAFLARRFENRRQSLLRRRASRQIEFDAGDFPDFLPETREIREQEWTVAPAPHDLVDRRVEITGPVDRKMVINGLNSGARVFMADFEDSLSPTWENLMNGQINLQDAVDGTISFTSPEGKHYKLNGPTATLIVRPRGWHLNEEHLLVDGRPISGALLDFGLFFFHNAIKLVSKGSGPYFYLPKLESHLEARLWNDVFIAAQQYIGLPCGTIRATVLIETITAVFEMDEILYVLREHCSGLNCGRWDYLFSFIKKFRNHPDKVTPNRAQLTMTTPFMEAYVKLLIYTCHRRGAHAMGGMAAQIPVRDDPVQTAKAIKDVEADKLREVTFGHDGTWVAHPGLIETAMKVFNEHMPTPNQISLILNLPGNISAQQLLQVPQGEITLSGVKDNLSVCVQYIENWLRGNGCVALNFKMEDAATAEISRTQVWQWIKHSVQTVDGVLITSQLVSDLVKTVVSELSASTDTRNKLRLAGHLTTQMILKPEFDDFLTTIAYPLITEAHLAVDDNKLSSHL